MGTLTTTIYEIVIILVFYLRNRQLPVLRVAWATCVIPQNVCQCLCLITIPRPAHIFIKVFGYSGCHGDTNNYNLRNSHNISQTANRLSISQQSFFPSSKKPWSGRSKLPAVRPLWLNFRPLPISRIAWHTCIIPQNVCTCLCFINIYSGMIYGE
jgi:hypothetical protein